MPALERNQEGAMLGPAIETPAQLTDARSKAPVASFTGEARMRALLADEDAFVRHRGQLGSEAPRIGLALSGGGVRSATVCLGFVETLSRAGLLECIDYLSSVSGGSYASGYLYAAAAAFGHSGHEELFGVAAKRELLATGKYLAVGGGLASAFRVLRLLGSFLSTLFLNLLWFVGVLLTPAAAVHLICAPLFEAVATGAMSVALALAVGVPLLRLATLSVAERIGGAAPIVAGKAVNLLEGISVVVIGAILALFAVVPFLATIAAACVDWVIALVPGWLTVRRTVDAVNRLPTGVELGVLGALAALTFVAGFLVSSNAIGLYSVFKNLIDSAYLSAGARAKLNTGSYRTKLVNRARVQARRRLVVGELS